MKVFVLGSVEVRVDDRVLRAPAKPMVVLVSLALAAGRPVSAEALADRLWDGAPGPTWRSSLYTYITRLRGRLEEAGFARTGLTQDKAGYILDINTEDVDWTRFSGLRSRAAAQIRSGDPAQGVATLEAALELWRGEPLPGLTERWAEDLRATMRRAHQAAWSAWAREAARVHPAEEVAERLSEASGLYPLNEALVVHLMRALHRSGRSADALEAFERVRDRVSRETGADAHPHLLHAHQEIMRATGQDGQASAVPAVSAITTNLPGDLGDFADRVTETDQILHALERPPDSTAARVCVLRGMPGVGKTSLAVHAAHRLAGLYPDGCLTVQLHGHHEHQNPLSAKEALGELLHLAGVPPARIGDSLHQRTAMWRDHTATRRILLLLDDAADGRQVVPLLPAGAQCAVIITSRLHLGDIDGARHLPVRVPTPQDAAQVFAAIADPAPHMLHTDDVAEIAELCGNLPLAMRLMAARLGLRPHWNGPQIIARLRAAADTVEEFRAGHRHLAAVFAVSLRGLSPEARLGFLRLGLHPTPSIDRHIAAAILGLDLARADAVLDELLAASLLETGPEATYRFHSLVLAFAHRSARAEFSPIEQHSLRSRMLSTYIALSARADAVLYPHRQRLRWPEASTDPVELADFATKETAAHWMTRQLPDLLVVIRFAVRMGWAREAAQLTHLLAEHIDAHGPWDAAVALHRQALAVWRGRGAVHEVAQSTYELARSLLRAGQIEEAERLITEAVRLQSDLGDDLGIAWAVDQQGVTALIGGDFERAVALHRQAQERFEQVGDRFGIAMSLDRRGVCHMRTGQLHEAIAAHSDALRLRNRLDDPDATANTRIHLACAYQGLGYHREATALTLEALERVRTVRDRRREGIITTNLGEIAAYLGEEHKALTYFHSALDIHREVHDPWTELITLSNLGRMHLKIGQLVEARQCLHDSRALCETYPDRSIDLETLLALGEVELADGDVDAAQEYFERAHDEAEQLGLHRERGQALTALGRVLLHRGSQDGARDHLVTAERIFTELDVPEASYVRIMIEALHEMR